MECPSCHLPVPEGARFCPSCGHAMSSQGDQRRVVTVVFADLVGYTSFSELLDPEQVKSFVDGCFELLVADVVAFGGRVDKIIGDAIVALFGAPVAHGDDAERAVRAALRMQRTVAEIEAPDGGRIEMRVGVNTGEVLVGALRAGGDYTAMGDVVNTAQRLQEAATPGTVLVGEATHAVTADVIRYEALGLVAARGREERVDTWVALEPVAPPGRRPRRVGSPMVGREPELGLLNGAIQVAFERRRAHVILLEGEAGVGKSRLAEEVSTLADERHCALVLEGQCVPYGEPNVWWPLAMALRDALGITDDASARTQCHAAVAALLGEGDAGAKADRVCEGLLALFGIEGGPLDVIDPTRAREEISRSVLAYLEARTRSHPVLLVVSDLHWADPLVLDLLGRAVEYLAARPFVLLATSRQEQATRWTPVGEHNHMLLRLDPLGRDSAATLLNDLVGQPLSDEVVNELIDRSGGNPFFLEELASLLAGDNCSERVPALPSTLRGLVQARLDGLMPNEREMIDNAAVLGTRGSFGALKRFADELGQGSTMETFSALAAKGLFVVDDERRWSFRSDSVRDVAYSTLTKASRAQRHVGVATAIAEGIEQDPELVETMAHHLATAAELVADLGPVKGVPDDLVERAASALAGAARRARTLDNSRVAGQLADRALRLAGGHTDAGRAELLVVRAWAAMTRGDLDASRADAADALVIAQKCEDPVAVARVRTLEGEIEQRDGHLAESAATLAGAIEQWQAIGDRQGEAEARRLLGMTEVFRFEFVSAEEQLVVARAMFKDLGDRRGEAWVDQHLAWIAFVDGDTDRADERLHSAASTFGELGDAGGAGWALGLLSWVRFQQGRFDEARAIAEIVRKEALERGDRWGMAMMLVLLADLHLWAGEIDPAIVLATDANENFVAIGNEYGQAQALMPLVRALVANGRVREAGRLLEEARTKALAMGVPSMAAVLGASAHVHLGDPRRALAAAWAVERSERDDRFGGYEWRVAVALAELQRGDAETALAYLDDALTRQGHVHAYALSARALVNAALGRTAEADDDAEAARGMPGSTYLDRLVADLAAACSSVQQELRDEAEARFAAAVAAADRTTDLVAQAWVRLARAEGLDAMGSELAAEAHTAAQARLEGIGIPAEGWSVAFRLAARGGDRDINTEVDARR